MWGKKVVASLVVLAFACGCATGWQTQSHFDKTVQTDALIYSEPAGTVYVNNELVGTTPVKIPLTYNQQYERATRKVTYWDTHPGLSLLITIVSLGIYLPFSFIPVDDDVRITPCPSFSDNDFDIRVVSDGYEQWREKVSCKGEKDLSFRAYLKTKGELTNEEAK